MLLNRNSVRDFVAAWPWLDHPQVLNLPNGRRLEYRGRIVTPNGDRGWSIAVRDRPLAELINTGQPTQEEIAATLRQLEQKWGK